jgi:tetratricopeptide (TPR) repeat protein
VRKRSKSCFVGLTLGFALVGGQQALALTHEDALENCRATVGRPIVQACMRGGGDRESCRAQASPKVRACVIAALNAANGRTNVPVAVPKEQGPSQAVAEQAETLPSGFVAPPRTITDITAILDSEKPDAAKIAKLHAEANALVPANAPRAELAQFYYQRGNARAQLGHLADAIADADRAIETARGAVDANQLGRLEQFAAIQYSFAGDPKHALKIFQDQLRDTNAKGARGFMFGAQRQTLSENDWGGTGCRA